MPTRVVFEATTLADVVKRAGQVAPSKAGNSFDRAAGVMFDITPDDSEVMAVIRSTNLDMYFMEVVDVVEATGDAVRWRIPSRPLDAILANQVAGGGNKQVVFDNSQEKDRRLAITCGRMRAGLNLIDNSNGYPDFDVSGNLVYATATAVGQAIERVAWAADKNGSDILAGVHFDGDYVIAANRQRMARMPLEVALDHPVTLPAGILPQLLRQRGDVNFAIDGNMVVIEPDDYTRITINTFGTDYPSVRQIMREEYPEEVTVRKDLVIAAVNSAMAVTGADRDPRLTLFFGVEQIAVYLRNDEEGYVGDIIDVSGQITHPRMEKGFGPSGLLDALSHAPSDKVTIKYDTAEAEKGSILVDGGSGYMVWLAPRGKHSI